MAENNEEKSGLRKALDSFHCGQAHQITRGIFTTAGAAPGIAFTGLALLVDNINSTEKVIAAGIGLTAAVIGGYATKLTYDIVHYCCFDLAGDAKDIWKHRKDPKPVESPKQHKSQNSSGYGHADYWTPYDSGDEKINRD